MERPLVAGLRNVPVMGSFLLNSATISTSRGRYAAGAPAIMIMIMQRYNICTCAAVPRSI